MLEKTIEKILVKAVKAEGGMCPKLISPGTDGMPARMVLLPSGCMGFVEVKAPGKKPRPLQSLRHQQLRDLGFKVIVIDEVQRIPSVIQEIREASENHTF